MKANIKKVKDILEYELSIPPFQRPYSWKEDNVSLLLQDVYDNWKEGKQSYRIGSTILYKPEKEEKLELVDGQQRITTILLILKELYVDFVGKKLCDKLEYKHNESRQNICQNHKFIENWIKKIENEKFDFYKYFVEHCEFVEIIVTDLSEAFQMFDSQNGRGKELEAYNLLKAYHIRAMETEPQETKIECDKRWESSTNYKTDEKEQGHDILKQVINEHLYYIRKWSKKNKADEFNKSHISEFKGLTVDKRHIINFPFQNSLLLQYIAKKYFESNGFSIAGIKSRFRDGDSENINPFILINQNIINGKHFFDYIETYVETYKQLFINLEYEPLKKFKEFYKKHCLYKGAYRTGDTYLREVYKSLLFLVFDKFGEGGIDEYYEHLYILIYFLRLELIQVKYNSIAKSENILNLFAKIENATNLQFLNQEINYQKKVECKKKVEEIIQIFERFKIKINLTGEI